MDQEAINAAYDDLSKKGLKLSPNDFRAVYTQIQTGIDDAAKYLSIENNLKPKINFSEDIEVIGFSIKNNAVNAPIHYLNLLTQNTTPIEFRDQLVCFVPDKFYIILKFLYWIKLFGRESTIHYFQRHGSPKLKIKFPDAFDQNLSPRTLLLSDLEVEARTIGDAIMVSNRENPIWKNVDNYFATNFPECYNKPIDLISKMQKPNLQISFELESILM